jgi:hypothetical protein
MDFSRAAQADFERRNWVLSGAKPLSVNSNRSTDFDGRKEAAHVT